MLSDCYIRALLGLVNDRAVCMSRTWVGPGVQEMQAFSILTSLHVHIICKNKRDVAAVYDELS